MSNTLTDRAFDRVVESVRWTEQQRMEIHVSARHKPESQLWAMVEDGPFDTPTDGGEHFTGKLQLYSEGIGWQDYSDIVIRAANGTRLELDTRYQVYPVGRTLAHGEWYMAKEAEGYVVTIMRNNEVFNYQQGVTRIQIYEDTGFAVSTHSNGEHYGFTFDLEMRLASFTQAGTVSTGDQTFAGHKTFSIITVAILNFGTANGVFDGGTF